MKMLKSVCAVAALILVANGMQGSTADAQDGDPGENRPTNGPPAWVVKAWETGEEPMVPEVGPPVWIVEAWQSGERLPGPHGMPPWIARRHAMAVELGLPGPPAEVIEAWENGEGADLPGPPQFILDLLDF